MPETILFEAEQRATRGEIADYLEAVASSLRTGEAVTLRAGDDEHVFDPPATLTFEVKAEREGPVDTDGELSVEFELEWDEAGGDAPLEVE